MKSQWQWLVMFSDRSFVIALVTLLITLLLHPLRVLPAPVHIEPNSQPALLVAQVNPAEQKPSPEQITTYTGNIATTSIHLDGRAIFRIAAADAKTDESGTTSPLAERVSTIQKRLYRVLDKDFAPSNVVIDSQPGQTVIVARASAQKDPLQDEILLVVTALDAQVNSLPVTDWADKLQMTIQTSLTRAQQERERGYLLQQTAWSGAILVGMLLSTTALLWVRKRIESHSHRQQQKHAESQLPNATAASKPARSILGKHQWPIGFYQLCQVLVLLNVLVVWLTGLGWIFGRFPWTRWLQPWLLQEPIQIIGLGAITFVALRLSAFCIDRLFDVIDDAPVLGRTDPQRQLLRFTTLSGVIKGLATFLILLLSAIRVLNIFHIPVEPLLASAGILGFGVTLAAQNLVRDVINGTFILLEDQYAIGDAIAIAGESGTVEQMNLRSTQLRSADGALITIPHSKVSVIQNRSKDWAQITILVELEQEDDLPLTLQMIRQTVAELLETSPWQQRILSSGDLTVLEVDETNHPQLSLALRIQAGQQTEVQSEFNQRLSAKLQQHSITFTLPQAEPSTDA